MFVECVMVSVNYSDYLAWSLPLNKLTFDKLVVVTSDEDWHTQNLCRHYNIECIKTNLFKDGKFPKSDAINIGLSKLSRKEWLVHMDSDIILPPRTREMFSIAKLNHDNIYSILRMNCPSYEEWIKFFIKPNFIHEKEIYVHLGAFPMGALVSKTYVKDVDFQFEPGFLPIGYFQMWSEKNGKHLVYPSNGTDCSRDDMNFSLLNFPNRENRQLIPEIVSVHIMTPDNTKGKNWSGRKTVRFGPDPNEKSVK